MKKIISITLILLIIAGLFAGCKNDHNTLPNHQLSKITVTKEPDSQALQSYNELFEYDYDSLQAAYDDLIGKYNETYDNDILYKLCESLDEQFSLEGNLLYIISNEYIANYDKVLIEYYTIFFNEVFTDRKFKRKTADDQFYMAIDLLRYMEKAGMGKESIDFYDKYIVTVNDADKKVEITYDYFDNYTKGENLDNEVLTAMLERSKEIEKKYSIKVYGMNKSKICIMISHISDKLGDRQTAEEYDGKAKEIIQKMIDSVK